MSHGEREREMWVWVFDLELWWRTGMWWKVGRVLWLVCVYIQREVGGVKELATSLPSGKEDRESNGGGKEEGGENRASRK